MTDARQFVAVKFNPWDRRTYTYHHDGEPVAVGDEVIVETMKGRAKVIVDSLPTQQPPFETKPILGLAPPPEDTPAEKEA